MGVKGIDHRVIPIAWEERPNRPGRGMPTIRIGDAQKINVHGPDWPARPGYLGARGLSTSVYIRDPDGNLVEFTVYDRTP
jgi:catechol 2,3-dioxygenase-like lactoylglutathione lyase family enzyme